MENASKALIMGGAILIAILIISVGIMIVNSTKGVTDQQDKANQLVTIESYNSQFSQYCGNRVIGSEVINLINFVETYKARYNTAPELKGINTVSQVKPARLYTVEVTDRIKGDSDEAGKIAEISIAENKS